MNPIFLVRKSLDDITCGKSFSGLLLPIGDVDVSADGQVCDDDHEVRPDPLHGRRHHGNHAHFRNLQDDQCWTYSCWSVQSLSNLTRNLIHALS